MKQVQVLTDLTYVDGQQMLGLASMRNLAPEFRSRVFALRQPDDEYRTGR
ncbi:hypothetical protein ACFYRW_23450 [Rhodococcus pyridinivorans]